MWWFIELSSYHKSKYMCILNVNFGGINDILCPLTITMSHFLDFITLMEAPSPASSYPPPLLPQPLLSDFMNLSALESSPLWNHIPCAFCAQQTDLGGFHLKLLVGSIRWTRHSVLWWLNGDGNVPHPWPLAHSLPSLLCLSEPWNPQMTAGTGSF